MEKINFKEEYGSLPANKQAKARMEIIEACDWSSRVTFYNKMNGVRGIKSYEKKKIKEVFAKYEITVFEPEE